MERRGRTLARAVACAAALGLWGAAGTAAAGPWTPDPGEGYAKLWVKWLPGFGYHDGGGATIDYGAYHELFVATYGEVGLAEGLALTWHTDLLRTFVLEDPRTGDGETHLAPGDPALGLRWRWLSIDRLVAAVELSARVPLARDGPVQTVYAAEGGHPEIGALRVGAGVFDFTGMLSAGYGWDRVYVSGGAGWVARTGGFDHALTWTAEVGSSFGEDWSGRVRVSGYHSVRTGDAPRTESPSGIGNGTSYTGIALEGEWQFVEGWYLGTTLEGGLFALRRQTGGPVINLFAATRF